MSPKEFRDTVVIPNFDDFVDDQTSLRKAFNAYISATHLCYHLWRFESPSGGVDALNALREKIGNDCQEFWTVHEITNGIRELGKLPNGKVHIKSSFNGIQPDAMWFIKKLVEYWKGQDLK